MFVRSNAETLGGKWRGSQSGWSLSPHMAAGKVINNAHRPPAYSPLHNDRQKTDDEISDRMSGKKKREKSYESLTIISVQPISRCPTSAIFYASMPLHALFSHAPAISGFSYRKLVDLEEKQIEGNILLSQNSVQQSSMAISILVL